MLARKKVSDSTKLCLIKGQKTKFPGRACPRTPLVCHMLCTQIRTCPPPPPIIHTISFCPPPPSKKLKETLNTVMQLKYMTKKSLISTWTANYCNAGTTSLNTLAAVSYRRFVVKICGQHAVYLMENNCPSDTLLIYSTVC